MVDSLRNNFLLLPALLLAGFLYGGFLDVQKASSYESLVPAEDALFFEGTVAGNPSFSPNSKFFKIKLRLQRAEGKNGLVAAAKGEADFFVPAALCQIYQPGKLYTAWRGKKVDLLLDQGARLCLEAKPAKFSSKGGPAFECKEIGACSFDKTLLGRLQKIRALCRLHFARLMFAWGDAGGLLLALLSGSRAFLNPKTADAFRLAGLSHVLALSGMHLSLIGGLALALGKKSFGKRAARFLELFAIIFFVWFAGKSPSLFRALLCSTIAFASSLFKVKAKSLLNVLALAFIIHVSLFPKDAFEISFQLSYGALFGILLFNGISGKFFTAFLPSSAGLALGSSAGAQALTLPLSLKYFGLFAPGGILSSAALCPAMTLFVYAGFAFVAVSLAFPFMAPLCGTLLAFFYKLISRAVFFFAGLPCVKL